MTPSNYTARHNAAMTLLRRYIRHSQFRLIAKLYLFGHNHLLQHILDDERHRFKVAHQLRISREIHHITMALAPSARGGQRTSRDGEIEKARERAFSRYYQMEG